MVFVLEQYVFPQSCVTVPRLISKLLWCCMKKIIFSLPAQLVCAIGAAFLVNLVACETTVGFFFTASSLLKEVLEFFLPLIVFFFVAQGIAAFSRHSVAMVALVLGLATISNALTGFYTYLGGLKIAECFSGSADAFSLKLEGMAPFYSLHLPTYLRSDHALPIALIVGCGLTLVSMPLLEQFLVRGRRLIEWGLTHLFVPLLPLYIFGFFLKMMRELPVGQLCSVYGAFFVAAVAMQLIWLFFVYLAARGFCFPGALRAIGVAAPSYLTALGTMSSVATLPVSVACAEKNTGNGALSRFAMPIFANIHLMGDAISVPLFAIATMKLFFGVVPTFAAYAVFVCNFCVVMLAVSGIPGGGIIPMLPLLKSMFGFTPEMLSIMMALYLLQDGFGTAANVMGDGALIMVLDRVSKKVIRREKADE